MTIGWDEFDDQRRLGWTEERGAVARFRSVFVVVLGHHETGEPGDVRHLPDGCGWVRTPGPIPRVAGPEDAELPECRECTNNLLLLWRREHGEEAA